MIDPIEAGARKALRLLESNLTPQGILTAQRSAAAQKRSCTRIFARHAGVCVPAMAASGVAALEAGAIASLDALARAQVGSGQIRRCVDPEGKDADFWYLGCIDAEHAHWCAYTARHQHKHPHQYHNGAIWRFVGGIWTIALARLGLTDLARAELARLAHANSLGDWRCTEWFHGRTLEPMGMAGQIWNAAAFLLARQPVEEGRFAQHCMQ